MARASVELIEVGPWAFGWSAVAALAAVFAAIVALVISNREVDARRRDREERGKLAAMYLWPDYRRFLAAIRKLRAHPIMISPTMAEIERVRLTRILGSLQTDLGDVVGLSRDLTGEDAARGARIVARVRHVIRHVTDLLVNSDDISKTAYEEKRSAISTAIVSLRADLLTGIQRSRSLLKMTTEQDVAESE